MFFPISFGLLYFMSVAMAIPALPKLINTIINQSDKVSSRAHLVLSSLLATDAFFTFLTNNLWGTLSDKYGRKPFIVMSSIGISIGALIVGISPVLSLMYIAAAIDGCTSCMFGLGQAYVCDISSPNHLAANLGVFMGVSAGVGFIVGIPLSAILMSKFSTKMPFYVSACIGFLNALNILFICPESLSKESRKAEVRLYDANPVGAIKMLSRNALVRGISLSYFLLWFAHVGLQATWMNFFSFAHGWSNGKSGGVLSVFGIATAILPKLVLKFFSHSDAIKFALLVYSVAMFLLANVSGDKNLYLALTLAALGSTALPSSLSFIANQAKADEKGAMQGASETVKSICSIVGQPIMSSLFAYWIHESRKVKLPGGMYMVSSGLLILSLLVFHFSVENYGSLDRMRRTSE